jgi:uncharacterized repeat protein (TIGR03847 family)
LSHPDNQFERITRLQPDAIGQPGKRRFRIIIENTDLQIAVLWIEKEQLFDFAVALKQLLGFGDENSLSSGIDTFTQVFTQEDLGAVFEFHVGRLGLNHGEGSGDISIDAFSIESIEESASPSLTFTPNQFMLKEFADNAIKLCRKGRPPCPLCGAPIDMEGHICPRHNGHVKLE